MASRRGQRPTGTDGSDHQYRMVVEKKYHKVADTKKRLRTLIALQALYYGCFIAWNCGIPLTEGQRPAPVVGVMPAVGFLALIAGRKGVGYGNERSNGTALLGYAFLSAVGFALVRAPPLSILSSKRQPSPGDWLRDAQWRLLSSFPPC